MADHLFDLVKSLNKNEKGYFKKYVVFASSNKVNNYAVLFDALDGMKEYNEEKLRIQLSGHSFIGFLSRQKNYLYDLILKFIHAYHLKNDAEIKLNGYLSSIKILYDKGLLDQCETLLWKSKKIIDRHFLYAHQIELNRYENKVALAKLNIEKIKQSRSRHLQSVEHLSLLSQYIELYGELYSLMMQTGNDIPKNRLRRFQQFSRHPLLTCSDKNLSLQAKHYYHRILTICYELMMEYEKAGRHSLKRLELFQKKPETIHLDPEQYINTLNNHIDILLRLKKYRDAKALTETLNKSHFNTLFLNARKTVRYYITDFKLSLLTFDFSTIVSRDAEVNEFITKNKSLIRQDEKIQLYFFISYALFAEGRFKDSLRQLNYILNSKDKIQEDFQVASRILNLVIHYELGNSDYLEYAVKSSILYIKKRHRLLNPEKLFLKFIKNKLLKTVSHAALINDFKVLKSNIQKKITQQEIQAFSYFNFIYWIDSKIQNKTYSAILKRSA